MWENLFDLKLKDCNYKYNAFDKLLFNERHFGGRKSWFVNFNQNGKNIKIVSIKLE